MRRILYTLFFLTSFLLALVVSTDAQTWRTNIVANVAPPVGLFGLPILILLTLFLVVFIFKNQWGMFFIGLLTVGFTWITVTGYTTVPSSSESNLKLATVNLLWDNKNHYQDAKDKIEELNPDIVILQEYYDETDLVGLKSSYPYVSEGNNGDDVLSNVLILSRYPFASEGDFKLDYKSMPYISVFVNGKTVGILGVHTVSPTDRERVHSWVNDLSMLSNWNTSAYDAVVFAGDFNANMTMKPFRDMINSNGLRVVNNFIPTWGFDWFKGGLIDNVLVSEKIYLKKLSVENIEGSDHALTYAELHIS